MKSTRRFFTLDFNYRHFLSLSFLFLAFSISALAAPPPEDCTNGVDDDSDGLIDLNDDDCPCGASGDSGPTGGGLVTNWNMEDLGCCTGKWKYSNPNCITGWPVLSSGDGSTDMYSATCPSLYDGAIPAQDEHALPVNQPLLGDVFQGGEIGADWNEFLSFPLHTTMPGGVEHCFNFWVADLMVDGNDISETNKACQDQPTLGLTLYGHETNVAESDGLDGKDCPTDNDNSWKTLGEGMYTPTNDGAWSNLCFCFTPPHDINELYLGSPCLANLPGEYKYNNPCTHY